MNTAIEQYWQRFQLLNQREKLMVVGMALTVIWAVWDNVVFSPLMAGRKTATSEIESVQTQIQVQLQQLALLQQSHTRDPNAEKRQQLAQLVASVDSLKKQLNSGDKKFVSPDQMASALSDMLKQYGNLKLTKLETLAATPFVGDETQKVWVYKHGMSLTLQGDFFSTMDYLKALEKLPWRIHWDHIDYEVKEYPIAETRIQVYTLSFEQDWLGV